MGNYTKWSIDKSKSTISFTVNPSIFSSVHGFFKTFDAKIYTVNKDFSTIKVDLWIDPSSINTGDKERDDHLKSADFFDVENHKQIIFTSGVVKMSDVYESHELWGYLTIKGITKEVKTVVEFGGLLKDTSGNDMAEFKITGKVNRKDWGLVWNDSEETGGVMEGEEANIYCEITLTSEAKQVTANN